MIVSVVLYQGFKPVYWQIFFYNAVNVVVAFWKIFDFAENCNVMRKWHFEKLFHWKIRVIQETLF